MELGKGLDIYSELDRKEYFKINQNLAESLWEASIPTVGDIANFMNGETDNKNICKVFDFFNNKEDFTKMINRTTCSYEEDESSTFIKKVMSANNDDISKAGYFYKLLMASADDFKIVDKDCFSDGVAFIVSEIEENTYNYKIKFMHIEELEDFSKFKFEKFKVWAEENNISEIHVRHPFSCNISKTKNSRGLCEKCAGYLPKNTVNVGNFTALMVTESATQSALSSMNKGRKENINEILSLRYYGEYSYESIVAWMIEIVDSLENESVSSRFYEIALLSRIRIDEDGELPFVSSLKGSISRSGNLFGSYIFTPNHKEFAKIIRKGEFDDYSLKLQIAMNDFK